MKAVQFLNAPVLKVGNKMPKLEKPFNRKAINISLLPKERQIELQERVTLASHCIEFLNDLVDEMRNDASISRNNIIFEYQKEMLYLQEYFINKSIDNNQEEERVKQQKRFEEVFTKVSKMKAKQLNKLINFIDTL